MSQQINLYNPALAPKVQLLSGRRLVLGLAAALVVCLLISVAVGMDAARLSDADRAQAAHLARLQSDVAALTRIFEQDLAGTEEVRLDAWRHRPLWMRIAEGTGRLVSPLL